MRVDAPLGDTSELAPFPDKFIFPWRDAQYHIESSVGEDQNPEVVLKAQQIHGMSYVNWGYFDATGQTPDGRLVPELDGTRGEPGGKRVANYLVASRIGRSLAEATATVRLLDIGPSGSIEDLPTYKYFQGTMDVDVKRRLQNVLALHGKRALREVAALATIADDEHRASWELVRSMIQNCMFKAETYGHRELYIASFTNKSLQPCLEFIDRKSVNILGDPVQIFLDDPRSRSIHVTPVLIDLSVVVDNTIASINNCTDESRLKRLTAKLDFLTDGL